MKKQWLATAAAVLMINLAGSAMAGEAGISVVFTDHETSVIRAYYRDSSATHSSKGKGKPRKSLPPGIAKQVAPGALATRLPHSRPGTYWYAAGNDLIEYDPVTRAVVYIVTRAILEALR